jgi:hypothetical protein
MNVRVTGMRAARRAARRLTTMQWLTIGLGVAAAGLAGIQLTPISAVVAGVVGTAAAFVAVIYASAIATYVVLGVVVVGPAIPSERPPVWQLVALAVLVTGFLLAPAGRGAWLPAAAAVPLAGAVAVLAQHVSHGTAVYLIGVAALIAAFLLALLPGVLRQNGRHDAAG